jgi:hypothetical protein
MVDDITNAAADAIEDAVRKSTVGIVVGSGAQRWLGIGTGTFIRWHGEHFILTANHVIDGTLVEDFRFFLPHDAPPLMVEREVLLALPGVPTSALRSFSEIQLGAITPDPALDLAAIAVSGSIGTTSPARFFDVAEDGCGPQIGQTSVVLGFPHDLSRLTGDDKRVVFTQVDWWPVEPDWGDLPGFDPTIHFLTRYSPPTSYPGANPRGLSGAARWARRSATPGVWLPNLDIIGVTVTYYPGEGLLKMVRREAVVGFLRTVRKAA